MERVYVNTIKRLQQIKNDIYADIWGSTTGILSNVMQSARIRVQLCICENGGHLQNIFRK